MNTSKTSGLPPSGDLVPASGREATQEPGPATGSPTSSIDEKHSLERLDSGPVSDPLLEVRDLEAQPEPHPASPEDLVPRRTKIVFVALYFLLNLSLTLSNKSVLRRVSASYP
jgi:hypothetical protein